MISIKCEICGMHINDKNIMLNKNALLKQNDASITSCPFCGVSLDLFIQYQDDKSISLDKDTLKILDHAMKLEVFNAEFYKQASILAEEPKLKLMFKELGNIELMHARVHQRMAGYEELPVVKQLDYNEYKGDETLLQLAETREKHAVGYYRKYITGVCSNSIKYIFEALCAVEEEHVILTSFRI